MRKQQLFQKLVEPHLVSGEMRPGVEIGIRIDQTLTQDSLGTMAYMHLESMGIDRVQTRLSVSYVDHLMLQEGPENANDHRYLQTVAAHYGVHFSKPGNGICHQVHLERFSRPGWTLLGCDSHTPTCGAVGMLAIGAGGLDVANAMAGKPFYFNYPRVIRINLHGQLPPWSTAKDVILEVLKVMTTKGNVGKVVEYGGPGVATLSVPERGTIANMGAELGVTTSIFPSDEVTREFLRAQSREGEWQPLFADAGAVYDDVIDINLTEVEPNVAVPLSPDNVYRVREVASMQVDQVMIGSCTNSSFRDLMTVAGMLQNRRINPRVSFGVVPGSRQVLRMIAKNGALSDIMSAGARLMESACGFCVGYGQSPQSGAVSVQTGNRNFQGRSGTRDAKVYLASPEVAVATALTGVLTDPRDLDIPYPRILMPVAFDINDDMIVPPTMDPEPVFRGPNAGKPPKNDPMPHRLLANVTIQVGDKVTTDHIMPAGTAGKYRSNVQKSSEFVFRDVDPFFVQRCQNNKAANRASVIVAGFSYGQGSSREHAALCPSYLGVRAVIAKSIERIHMTNLINFGIVPLLFTADGDYEQFAVDDELVIDDMQELLRSSTLTVHNITKRTDVTVTHDLTMRQVEIVLCGGLINFVHT
ncbi:aconitate hydratase [Alicyclobacillus tolerans]|uniref:aconitate hydratase n=1 Tax=Alicyclobacillus tolerans TaxID=90970 RepID=UPI002351B4A6|nr:aconitate hydratase [Alicyclobacillus tolerans]MCF8567827.1 aconitate hydratase [Alicyclobacillus tolerans]